MFGSAGRRLVEGIVSLFAVLGFVYVPLGRHTGYEHARAVLTTPAASEALTDLGRVVIQLRQTALEFVTQRPPTSTDGKLGPAQSAKAAERDPRPVPPKLK